MTDHKPLARATVTYVSAVQPHHQTVTVVCADPPTPGVMPTLLQAGLGTIPADEGLTALWTTLKAGLHTTTKIGYWQMDYRATPTDPWQFIYAGDLGLNGTATADTIPASQAVWTFKTLFGNRLNLYLMDGIADPNFRELPPLSSGWYKTVSDYILGELSIVYGQDEKRAFALHAFTTKTNDPNRKHAGYV